MSASVTNAGKEDWTYYNTFTGSTEHDLPANWTALYIYVIANNTYADTILLLKDALPSGASHYVNGSDTMIEINANTNKISAMFGTAKVYYR